MSVDRIKFTLPNGDITIRDLTFSQSIETLGDLSDADAEKFWRKEEITLPKGSRPWQGCKAYLVREGV